MPPEALIQRLRQRPFVPFRLHVSDGSLYEIRHPDLVWVAARLRRDWLAARGPASRDH